jgi:polyisoprenoid-binding protein YceI
MNKNGLMYSLTAATAFGMLLGTPALASTWEIDGSHSAAQFSVRHLMVSNVRGEFGKVSGTVSLDDKDVTKSSVDVSIDVASINTREPKRDEHLRSPDFFDVAKYPKMTFKSTGITKQADGKYAIAGNLTLHGVTKPITLVTELSPEVKDPWNNVRRGATGTATLSRKDFGLTWNKALEAGGVAVGDEVKITVDVEMVKKADAAPAKPSK